MSWTSTVLRTYNVEFYVLSILRLGKKVEKKIYEAKSETYQVLSNQYLTFSEKREPKKTKPKYLFQ